MTGKPGVRPRRLTIAEQRELMATSGDVDGLFDLLVRSDATMLDWERTFALLLRAVETRSRQHPALFAAEMLARLFAVTSFLVLRTHYHAGRLIAAHDRSTRGCGSPELPRGLPERARPRS